VPGAYGGLWRARREVRLCSFAVFIGGEVLPKFVQIALCIIEIGAARLIYIIIQYKTFLCLSLPPLCYIMVLLDYLIVLCFLI
jgi:hypothetical protein